MILVLDETRERIPRASFFIAQALSDLAVGVVAREPHDVGTLDLARASGIVLCELDEPAFRRTLRILEDSRLNLEWKVVACVGAEAERIRERLLSLTQPPGAVFCRPTASSPVELRAIGLVVYARAKSLRRFSVYNHPLGISVK